MPPRSLKSFHYVQAFTCLAEKCEDNCCNAGWKISVSPQCVDTYQKISPELLDLIVTDGDSFQMNNAMNDECAALQDGLCSIHAKFGEAALPDTCATYPRMNRHFDNFNVQSATMSCPEIARLVLFGDTPFRLEDRLEPVNELQKTEEIGSHLVELDVDCWAAITSLFSEQLLIPHQSVEQILSRLCRMGSHFEDLPYHQWIEASTSIDCEHLILTQEADVTDQLLHILIETLGGPTVPARMRQSVLDAIDMQPTAVPEHHFLALKPALHEILPHAEVAIENTLKRFIAAEMTRTGFPFISTTSNGLDYGLSLSEWAATLAIRTSVLRLLLLAHGADKQPEQLTPQQIVDLIYRYCRAINHSPATVREIKLRQKISTKFTAANTTIN